MRAGRTATEAGQTRTLTPCRPPLGRILLRTRRHETQNHPQRWRVSLLDDAFWEALDAAQGDEDAAFTILKVKLANPSAALIQELRWIRSRYADDTEDVLKETLRRFAEKWRAQRGDQADPSA